MTEEKIARINALAKKSSVHLLPVMGEVNAART